MTPARDGRATLTAYCSQCATRFTLTCHGPQVTADVATSLACPLCAWEVELTLEAFQRAPDLTTSVSAGGKRA